MKLDKNFLIKKVLPVLGGAVLGYAYFYFVGCYSGTCPITSNPYISTFYGGLIALILVFPTKTKKDEQPTNSN
ncbi:MAG: YtxH domain-containing protein [Ignavibacteria bacterium]|nr:YtxH domain-containing protein [Ignavibacteria bacterium]